MKFVVEGINKRPGIIVVIYVMKIGNLKTIQDKIIHEE